MRGSPLRIQQDAEEDVKIYGVALKQSMRFTIPLSICSCTLAAVGDGIPCVVSAGTGLTFRSFYEGLA